MFSERTPSASRRHEVITDDGALTSQQHICDVPHVGELINRVCIAWGTSLVIFGLELINIVCSLQKQFGDFLS